MRRPCSPCFRIESHRGAGVARGAPMVPGCDMRMSFGRDRDTFYNQHSPATDAAQGADATPHERSIRAVSDRSFSRTGANTSPAGNP